MVCIRVQIYQSPQVHLSKFKINGLGRYSQIKWLSPRWKSAFYLVI
jgi:hypothetical protein